MADTEAFLTQIVVNIISVIIMSNISLMEYQINAITSAIWAELINAVGGFALSGQNYVRESIAELLLTALQMAFVIAGLAVFIASSNRFFEGYNEDSKQRVETGAPTLPASGARSRSYKR